MSKSLVINFIGNFTTGYVGESADEIHLARELESLGHTVQKVPRDQWKGFVDGDTPNADWVLPIKSDINIICKWDAFNHEKYIGELRLRTEAPTFYWVWDYMRNEEWHQKMIEMADLYIANDVYSGNYEGYTNCHYFPFDVADGTLPTHEMWTKKYDTVFFGSKIGQGDRVEWLQELNKSTPVTIFSWNYEEWQKLGFTAYPAVYGEEFTKTVSQSKVILGFNVNDYTWGYWSNRVGKVLTAGGFLLQRYVPGMELLLRDGVAYFSSKEEMTEKVKHYLNHESERNTIAKRGADIGNYRLTSRERIKDLVILIERFLAGGFV